MQTVYPKRRRKLSAAENERLCAALRKLPCGLFKPARVKIAAAGLHALVYKLHDGGLRILRGRQQLDAAALKAFIVNPGAHCAVGCKKSRTLDALAPQLLRRELYHVQNGNIHRRAHRVIKAVRRIAGHGYELGSGTL